MDRYKLKWTTYWLACKKVCVMGEQKTHILKFQRTTFTKGPLHKDMQLSRWRKSLHCRPLMTLERGGSVISGNTHSLELWRNRPRPIRFIGMERLGVRFGASRTNSFSGWRIHFRLFPFHTP